MPPRGRCRVPPAAQTPHKCASPRPDAGYRRLHTLLNRTVAHLQPRVGGHVGGSFGRGLDIYPFEPIAALLARASGRPVRVAFDRAQEFLAAPLRQPMRGTIRAGARQDGTLLFRDVTLLLDGGAYISWGVLSPVAVQLLQLRETARMTPEQLAMAALPRELVALLVHLAAPSLALRDI